MKKYILIGVALVMTACSSTNYATHKIKETPTFTRQALIYDTHVVIVTRTTLTPEQYAEMRANSNVNK
jgi:hypothetical protein